MTSPDPPPLILASGSPRRSDLLTQPGESPLAFAERLARDKALTVATRTGPSPARWVLAADTIVIVDDEVLGKPRDEDHALELLERLTGRSHTVVTAVALATSDTLQVRQVSVESRVTMRTADRDELIAYVATGESMDKAGGYAVQGGARSFVTQILGSETNVIGLPLEETLDLLVAAGIESAV